MTKKTKKKAFHRKDLRFQEFSPLRSKGTLDKKEASEGKKGGTRKRTGHRHKKRRWNKFLFVRLLCSISLSVSSLSFVSLSSLIHMDEAKHRNQNWEKKDPSLQKRKDCVCSVLSKVFSRVLGVLLLLLSKTHICIRDVLFPNCDSRTERLLLLGYNEPWLLSYQKSYFEIIRGVSTKSPMPSFQSNCQHQFVRD